MKKTPSEYQKIYTQRQNERGMVRVSVWVPEERRQELHAAVARLRKKWAKAS